MPDISPTIETLENRWMRAWASGNKRSLKAMTSRKFRMVVGSKPCVMLDAKSWLDAAGSRYRCRSYRFGDLYARQLGSVAVFAAHLDLQATMDDQEWSGQFWVTDVWRRSAMRRSWTMVERILSRPDEQPDVAAAIRTLQLWR